MYLYRKYVFSRARLEQWCWRSDHPLFLPKFWKKNLYFSCQGKFVGLKLFLSSAIWRRFCLFHTRAGISSSLPFIWGLEIFCLSFIPPFSACFFVWFKSAHSLSKSAHKGQGSVCHISPFPVCLIDQSGIFSWHSPPPQPSHAPQRHQTLVEFTLLHVSAAVMHPDERHFDYCRLQKKKKKRKNEFIIILQNKTGCSIQLYLQFASLSLFVV